MDQFVFNQRTIGPENAHLKPDLGVFSHHEMTLTLNNQICLGYHWVIICINYDGLRSMMLQTKLCGNPPTGSGEDF